MKINRQRLLGFCVILSILILLPQLSLAQDDGDQPLDPAVAALLSQIRDAYTTTAAQESYQIEIEDESTQSASVRRFVSGTYLMDVLIYESYVNAKTLTTDTLAMVESGGVDVSATFDIGVEQSQGLGFEYVRLDEVVSQPEDRDTEVDVQMQLLTQDGNSFINTDATAPEFRVGVPMGWRAFDAESTPISSDSNLTQEDLLQAILGFQLETIAANAQLILQPEIVVGIDILEDDEVNGEVTRQYQITFDGEAALRELGIDVDQVMSALQSLSSDVVPTAQAMVNVDYRMTLSIGVETQLVYSQSTILNLNSQADGDGGSSAVYTLSRSNEVSLSRFGERFDLAFWRLFG